jgi:hypothetical protein
MSSNAETTSKMFRQNAKTLWELPTHSRFYYYFFYHSTIKEIEINFKLYLSLRNLWLPSTICGRGWPRKAAPFKMNLTGT